MIRITDMTLSCIASSNPSSSELKTIFELLALSGCDLIEMPATVFDVIDPFETKKLVLRLNSPEDAAKYPQIDRFICRKSGVITSPHITSEIQINDVKEISFPGKESGAGGIRVVGLDDVLCHDYERAFSKMRRNSAGHIEFCPENSRFGATAAAVSWIMCGGTDVAASFGGICGKAATEEVLVALRVAKRYKPNASFAVFPQIAALIEDILSIRFSDRKAVIGRHIFNVESGIHVDGILKKPQMYEPFSPELVGGKRRLFVGKHSGRRAIAAKLAEEGLIPEDFDILQILSDVRDESTRIMSSLTDEEFFTIASKYRI